MRRPDSTEHVRIVSGCARLESKNVHVPVHVLVLVLVRHFASSIRDTGASGNPSHVTCPVQLPRQVGKAFENKQTRCALQ
jgi:hypothetical protein